MIPYQTKIKKLPGTSYSEVRKSAKDLFKQIKSKTKRKPYIKSAYFKKQKIFFDFFWIHLTQKGPRERFKRLKYFAAAVEVIKKSKNQPSSKQNPNKSNEKLHRFAGLTKKKELFYVQIKESKRGKSKYFMSCFPPE
ncbi:hypothetical protein KKG58_01625 [Patescibacteria group bacterium]|nr:hypothetical protein [Patescibacteria group bacterium]